MKKVDVKSVLENPLHFTDEEKGKVLERFMKEHFHFPTLRKVGFFTKEMRGDYKAQADRVCQKFGFKTVFEYKSKTTEGIHLSYADWKSRDGEPFAFKIRSIYD
jgi:hypothetical protein